MPDMLCVFLKRARKDEDVIQVNEHEYVKHIPKHIVYERLEHSRALVRPKDITKYS